MLDELKDKNVDFNAGKWKNEMTHPEFEPRTFSTEVRYPYPYTTKSLGKLARKIMKVIIQWQKVANI